MRKIIITVAMFFIAVGSAQAAGNGTPGYINWKTIGTWFVQYNNELCHVFSTFDFSTNTRTLGFRIWPLKDQLLEMQLYDSHWKIPNGTYSVLMSLDGILETNPATGRGGSSIFMSFTLNSATFSKFGEVKELGMEVGNERMRFDMANSREALHELLACAVSLRARLRGEPLQPPAKLNPFAG